MQPYNIKVVLTNKDCMPAFMSEEAAGLDMRANITDPAKFIVVAPKQSVSFDLGCKIQIPKGWCGIIAPRSGLGVKYKMRLDNTVGIIDSDYRNVVGVYLTNEGRQDLLIEHGMRICQMVVVPHLGNHNTKIELVESLDDSTRGLQGWGSSGIK